MVFIGFYSSLFSVLITGGSEVALGHAPFKFSKFNALRYLFITIQFKFIIFLEQMHIININNIDQFIKISCI